MSGFSCFLVTLFLTSSTATWWTSPQSQPPPNATRGRKSLFNDFKCCLFKQNISTYLNIISHIYLNLSLFKQQYLVSGLEQQKIVNGELASPHEFPFMVSSVFHNCTFSTHKSASSSVPHESPIATLGILLIQTFPRGILMDVIHQL